MSESTLASYNTRFVPQLFDVLISTIFAPFGGIHRLRVQAIEFADIGKDTRVLELGCGTGAITRLMLERGARITAVDGSYRMLERARQCAAGADFVQQELESLSITGQFDVVLFAFVLHELPRSLRREVLMKATQSLTRSGAVVVVDHAVPKRGLVAKAWRGMLMRLEPATVAECIEEGYESDMHCAGLHVTNRRELAAGTASITVSRR